MTMLKFLAASAAIALFTLPARAADDAPRAAPVALSAHAQEVAAILEAAPFVRDPAATGPVLYAVTFRSCPTCLAFKAAEHARLKADGADVRWLVYARADREGRARSTAPERAAVAELALSRDYALFTRWYEEGPAAFYEGEGAGLESADREGSDRARVVADLARVVADLARLSAPDGVDLQIPALFWRDAATGALMVSVGYSEDGFPAVRASLGLD